MRVVDVSRYVLVKSGVPCYTTAPVHANTLIQLMQCEEKYIYWFQRQPDEVSTQISCVYVNDKFYNMPLRLEKAVFRHVRLCKNFENTEVLEDGTPKLRMPLRLLREKMRTSVRLQGMATPNKKSKPPSRDARAALHKKAACGEDPCHSLTELETALRTAPVLSLVLPRDEVLTHLLLMWQHEFATPDPNTIANAVALLVVDAKP